MTPSQTITALTSVPDMLAKVRRLLAASKSLSVPCGVAAKATGCAGAEEFEVWWVDLEIPGFELDYDANVMRAEGPASLGALDAAIAALRGSEA
jgi:hypothetical protein